jgi:hypothetical protein
MVVALFSTSYAAWEKKPELRWANLYRIDTRNNNGNLYATRISAAWQYLDSQRQPLFKITPYAEFRRNIDNDVWERGEVGCEIGKDIFPWLYIGEGIHQAWLKENYRSYTYHKERKALEGETRFLLSHTLLDNKHVTLKGFILNEYTYDFDLAEGTRNEVAIGFIVPLCKHIETCVNWRHVDRIHDYDSDLVEFSVTTVF